jgi:Zn-dependent protease
MLTTGFWHAGTIRGVPIRFHWSILLGALIFSGFRFSPAFWLAFPLLVLIHELGHAWVIQRLGHRALAIDVTGFGGLCHWDPRFASRLHHALVAWGGVAAQFLLFLAATAYTLIKGGPSFYWEAEVLHVFTTTNLFLIALNLLPFPPLDGARAWTLFGELSRMSFRSRPAKKPPASEFQPPPLQGPATTKAAKSDGSKNAEIARLFERAAEEARNARR